MKIVFCLPGNSFSGNFLQCWTTLLTFCHINGIECIISQKSSCNIYYVRNMCLGGDVMRGAGQKPFNGKLDYDYIMWIDSDIMFSPVQFATLLDHNLPIVSGVYLMAGGNLFATCKNWDEDFFKIHGHFEFLTPDELQHTDRLLNVAYTGMGFMLVKRGVFESLEYPWFSPIEKRIGQIVDFTMEDVSFCLRARKAGFNVLVDTAVRVGHEKTVVYS